MRLSIKWKLIIIVLLFMIPILVVSIFFYTQSNTTLINLASNHSTEQLKSVERQLEEEITNLSLKILRLRWDKSLLGKLELLAVQSSPRTITQGIIVKTLKEFVTEYGFDSGYILTNDDILYATSGDFTIENVKEIQEKWVYSEKTEGKAVKIVSSQSMFSKNKTNQVVSFVVNITKEMETGTFEGVMVFNKTFSSWMMDTYGRAYGKEILIIDNDGERIFTLNDELKNEQFVIDSNIIMDQEEGFCLMNLMGEPHLAVWQEMFIPGFKVIKITPATNVTGTLDRMARIALMVFLIIVVASVLMIVFFSASIVKPITALRMTINNMKTENKTLQKRTDEIGELSRSYSALMKKQTEMIHEIEQTNKKKREMELQLLGAQINPHFIYNTINSIRSIALIQGNKSIAGNLQSLSRLLQSSVHIGRNFLTIREEVSQLKDYIQLQKMRYMDSFDVIFDIDPDALDMYTMSFLAQPIVENAIFHGIDNNNQGLITIRIKISGSSIMYHISDNGHGIEESKLELLKNHLESGDVSQQSEHIGLKNIKDRLTLFFGTEHSLMIKSILGKGTHVIVKIPILNSLEEAEDR